MKVGQVETFHLEWVLESSMAGSDVTQALPGRLRLAVRQLTWPRMAL
jgi:hypothetical protein